MKKHKAFKSKWLEYLLWPKFDYKGKKFSRTPWRVGFGRHWFYPPNPHPVLHVQGTLLGVGFHFNVGKMA